MSSDSGDRKPEIDVSHVVEQLLGGSCSTPKARAAPKQKRTDRVHLRVVDEPVAWMPKSGLPEGGRDECRNGERPCPYVRCKWHLWLVLGEDRRGRRWQGRAPSTTLLPAWLEYPTPACCALDVAEAIATEDADAPVKRIADVMHLSRSKVHDIVAESLKKLKAMRDEALLEHVEP